MGARDLFHRYQSAYFESEQIYNERQREVLDRLAEASDQYAITAEEAANGMSELLRRVIDIVGDKKELKKELDSSNDEEVDAFIL